MKSYLLLLCIASALSCKEVNKLEHKIKAPTKSEVTSPVIQKLLDASKLNGAILIYDVQKQTYFSNDFIEAKKQVLPASTFKIPNSIIGLETGLIKNENSIFKWDGKERAMAQWEKDLTLGEAFQASCVPCYQELARQIGTDTMLTYLTKLNYPAMDVSQENIDMFWLVGDSKISPMQQITFLERLYSNQLKISPTTSSIMKHIMKIDSNEKFSLSAKSGWAIIDDANIGWYVGYVEQEENIYYFATRISPDTDFDMGEFVAIRKEITLEAFRAMELVE